MLVIRDRWVEMLDLIDDIGVEFETNDFDFAVGVFFQCCGDGGSGVIADAKTNVEDSDFAGFGEFFDFAGDDVFFIGFFDCSAM